MRPRIVLPVLIALTVVGSIAYRQSADDSTRKEVEELARRQRQQQQITSPDPVDEFESLAAQGKGQPVPRTLTVAPDPEGFWFVGMRGSDVGAQIPFRPGHVPDPPPGLEPAQENPGFLGAQSCQRCHPETYATFVETAHHRTSRWATPESIAGSFRPGKNKMRTHSPDVHFTMIQRDDRCFQRVSFFDWNFEIPFQIITGSAKMAETYLYWHADRLYQMNVTYLTSIDDWINSPGYIDGDAAYARPIRVRCLECHTTYIDLREASNHYTPDSLILGISCERCHGPGLQHVEYHNQHPNEKIAKYVTVPSDLSRELELQVCSQCHSGITLLKDKPYQFRPGDKVSDHYHPPATESGHSVHTSNQLSRLSLSPCFTETEMTCITCHNPHHNERGDVKLFSLRCMKCHEPEACGMHAGLGDRVTDNCISCHMPVDAGDQLRLETSEGSIFPALRDHHIRVEIEATANYLREIGEFDFSNKDRSKN